MGACLSSSSTADAAGDEETDSVLDERERREREEGQRKLRDLVAKGLLAERQQGGSGDEQGEGNGNSTGKQGGGKQQGVPGVDWDAVIKTADELHRREVALQRKRDRREKKKRRRRSGGSGGNDNGNGGGGGGGPASSSQSSSVADYDSCGSYSAGRSRSTATGGSSKGTSGSGGGTWKRARERRLRRRRDALGSFSVNMATYRSDGVVVVLGDRRRREEFAEAERRAMERALVGSLEAATAKHQASTTATNKRQAKGREGRKQAVPMSAGELSEDNDVPPSPPPSPEPDFKSPSWSVSTGVTTEITASTTSSHSPGHSPAHSPAHSHSDGHTSRSEDECREEGVEVVTRERAEAGTMRAEAEGRKVTTTERRQIAATEEEARRREVRHGENERAAAPPPAPPQGEPPLSASPTGSFEEAISGGIASPSSSSANVRGGDGVGVSGTSSGGAICSSIRESGGKGTMPTILE